MLRYAVVFALFVLNCTVDDIVSFQIRSPFIIYGSWSSSSSACLPTYCQSLPHHHHHHHHHCLKENDTTNNIIHDESIQNVFNKSTPSWLLQHSTRRTVLHSIVVFFTTTATTPSPAYAAAPMQTGEADNLGALAERFARNKPPKILRPKLDLSFAILLMRSSYNALDQLDCVPMDQFQRDFFMFRQAEYQSYIDALKPGGIVVSQGNLVDPYYFDFISFAQYATISRDVSGKLPIIFQEQQPILNPQNNEEDDNDNPQQFEAKLIKRDATLLDNELLPIRHGELVGTAILDHLNDIFNATTSAIPAIPLGSRPDANTLLSSLKQLVNLFLMNGFAWSGTADIVKEGGKQSIFGAASGTEFAISFVAPATLWSGKALQLRKAKPVNDFILKAAIALVSRAGYRVSSSSVEYSATKEVSRFSIA